MEEYPELEQMIEELKKPEESSRPVRPEAVMAIIAAVCAVLFCVVLFLSWPYMGAEEDPEALARPQHLAEEAAPEVSEEATEETAPETEPTIPPDLNPYGPHDFQFSRSGYLKLEDERSFSGVDVSAFQGDIDWQQVKDSGIQFAIIRLGYRGYGKAGKMVEDEYAQKNLKEVTEVGLPYGVYFFSQALNKQEVKEEVDFLLKILGDYEPSLPIVFDWEYISAEARTANMDARTLTDCALYFGELIEEAGYTPMIYFNWYQSTHYYYLHELERYPFWLALYQDRMTYPYRVEMWQYTCTGTVPGIQGDVDINVYMPW